MTNAPPWLTVGWLIALIILVLCVVFTAIGKVDLIDGALIGGLALSRLVP